MALFGTISPDNTLGFRNRVINGDMRVDQRQAGSALTVSPSNNVYFGLDRFQLWSFPSGAAGTWTWQQQTSSPPEGYSHYGRATVTAADSSVAGNDYYTIQQAIEGYNVADFDFGKATAKPFTVSFWVRSSVTGTFSCAVYFETGVGYPLTYTISSANTWEYKTINFPAITSSSITSINKTNGLGLYLIFSLGLGSTFTGTSGVLASNAYGASGTTNLISTNGATFDITGIQLEVGSTATTFERRPYGTELQLCQRYCNVYGEKEYSIFGGVGFAFSTTQFVSYTQFPVDMRVMPTVTYRGNTRSNPDNQAVTAASFNTTNSSTKFGVVELTVASGLTTNRGYNWTASNDTTARAIFSAEL